MLRSLYAGYQKIKQACKQQRQWLKEKINTLFSSNQFNEETREALEEILYQADLGIEMTTKLLEQVEKRYRERGAITDTEVLSLLREEILAFFDEVTVDEKCVVSGPKVILILGTNGHGKTTTIGKLGHRFCQEGKKVLFAAGDTFRAAAIEQLDMWSNRVGASIVKNQQGADPSSVIFDALQAGKAREFDYVLIDTAGRLQTKENLMKEAEKMYRTCKKIDPAFPHEVWFILDATTGQNAVHQVQTFHQFIPLTGLILSKLDGTCRGGSVIGIQNQLKLPVRWIGVGEGKEDIEPFDKEAFAESLLG